MIYICVCVYKFSNIYIYRLIDRERGRQTETDRQDIFI